jgi:hypothetical protein
MIFDTPKYRAYKRIYIKAFTLGSISTLFIMFLLHSKPYTFTNLDINQKGKNKQLHTVGHHIILPDIEIAISIDSDEYQTISINNHDFEITKINKVSNEFVDRFEVQENQHKIQP